jgi:hypothetical protein
VGLSSCSSLLRLVLRTQPRSTLASKNLRAAEKTCRNSAPRHSRRAAAAQSETTQSTGIIWPNLELTLPLSPIHFPPLPLEPPYGSLWKELKQGNIVAFLGAGASLSGRPENSVWTDQSAYLPKGSELSRWLAEDAGFPSGEESERRDLAKVASYFESQNDRLLLRQRLRQVFARSYQPGLIHHFLAQVEAPLLIVTTNYDNLIERSFQEAGGPYHLTPWLNRAHPAVSVRIKVSNHTRRRTGSISLAARRTRRPSLPTCLARR